MIETELRTTPIYDCYKDEPGVKLIDFGGWYLPVNFSSGIIAEHLEVRSNVGMFDVSHMGECMVTGPGARAFLDWMITNDVASLRPGHVVYGMMCYERGTVVDDLLVYCIDDSRFFVVLNASNADKDLAYLLDHKPEGVAIEDLCDATSQIALQGPNAEQVLKGVWPGCTELGFFDFSVNASIFGCRALVSRTGYTGEDGFEIYLKSSDGPKVWKALLEKGVMPCGLGARDTLRMEAKLPLYGHELSDQITPLEANLGVFVKLDKSFIGRDALLKQKEEGIPRSLRGFEMVEGGVARYLYSVYLNDEQIGYVTSGCKSPSLDKFVGYALIRRDIGLKFGDLIDIEIHGKLRKAKLVKTPFCKHSAGKSEA